MFVELLKEVVDMDTKPRNVTIFLIRRLRGEKLEEIGRQFGIAKYSSVSSAIEKMKRDISVLSPVWNRAKITVLNEARTIFGHSSPFSSFNDFYNLAYRCYKFH